MHRGRGQQRPPSCYSWSDNYANDSDDDPGEPKASDYAKIAFDTAVCQHSRERAQRMLRNRTLRRLPATMLFELRIKEAYQMALGQSSWTTAEWTTEIHDHQPKRCIRSAYDELSQRPQNSLSDQEHPAESKNQHGDA